MTLLLLGHVIGDYYLQTDLLAKKKESNINAVFLHSMIYALSMFVVMLPFLSVTTVLAWLLASLFHAAIDFLRFSIQRMLFPKGRIASEVANIIFLFDQFLHAISILLIGLIFGIKQITVSELPPFETLFEAIGLPGLSIVSWLFVLLFLHKPANMIVQAIIGDYASSSPKTAERDRSAGVVIGTMERIVMVVLIIIHQYFVIGLLIVAKSIARFLRIARERSFAEYYIIGTMASTIIAIMAYQLLP